MIAITLAIASCLTDESFSLAGSQLSTTMTQDGLQVAIAQVAGENEYFAIFHRGGLLDDGLGETQWSHLLEHLVVRNTDVLGDTSGGQDESLPKLHVQPNGETGGHVLRLEALFRVADAEPLTRLAPRSTPWTQFRIAERHAAAEAARAIEELDFAERTGHAHKWALAAWNQARRGATHVELRTAIANADQDALATAASRMRARRPPLLLFHGGIDRQRALEFATTIPVAAPEPGIEDPSRDPPIAVNPQGKVTWDLSLGCVIGACDVPAATPSERLAGLLAAESLLAVLVSSRNARDLRNPLLSFEAADGAAIGKLLITAATPPRGSAQATRAALERTLAALATEVRADPESAADNLDALRRRSFATRARVTFGSVAGSDPYAGAQVSIDAAYHRVLLGVSHDEQLEAAYREYDPEDAATDLANWLAPNRWSWLELQPN